MTQPASPIAPAPAPTTPAAAATAPAPRPTAAARARAILAKASAAPESAGEGAVTSSPSLEPSPADSGAAPAAQPDAAAQARAERMARIQRGVAELRAKEAAALAERQQRAKYQRNEGEVETLRKRLAELEPLEGAWKDPMSVLEWAEKKGVKAGDMVAALRERQTNPEAVAAAQAAAQTRTLEQTLRAEIAAINAKLELSEKQRIAEIQQAREQAEGQRKAVAFQEQVTAKAAEYPLTANFVKARGTNALIALANNFLAPHLPEDYTVEQLHDHTEQLLELFQVSGLSAPSAVANAGEPSKSPGAEQPATTLSNRATAGRETLVEEVPLHRLSKADRIARVRAKYGRK